MAHKKQGYRFENDYEKDDLNDSLKNWGQALTLPVDVEIKAEHQILSMENAKELLENAELIARMNCICRTTKKNCDSPIDNCMSLNDRAKMILNNEIYQERNPRPIDIDEALELLRGSHEAGLVHMAYAVNDQDINELCSCCSCCCVALSAILRYGLYPHLLTKIMIEETDSLKCIDCGVCVDRCQFGARQMIEGKLVVDQLICYGCGLCIGHCSNDAIKLNKVNP